LLLVFASTVILGFAYFPFTEFWIFHMTWIAEKTLCVYRAIINKKRSLLAPLFRLSGVTSHCLHLTAARPERPRVVPLFSNAPSLGLLVLSSLFGGPQTHRQKRDLIVLLFFFFKIKKD
jgi:hypothetical protein